MYYMLRSTTMSTETPKQTNFFNEMYLFFRITAVKNLSPNFYTLKEPGTDSTESIPWEKSRNAVGQVSLPGKWVCQRRAKLRALRSQTD